VTHQINLKYLPGIFTLIIALFLILIGCDSESPTPTPTEIAEAIATEIPATDTPVPPTSVPTKPPTATVTQTPTAIPTETPTPKPVAKFETADCQFTIPAGQEVECGYLTVPEDHTQPESDKTVRLHVAIFKSDSQNPAPDPIVYLEGGPGGDALEAIPFVFETNFTPFVADRDLIIFDQRGTGYSKPSLACPEDTQRVLETLDQDLNVKESLDLAVEALLVCRDRLQEEGVNLAVYNSAQNAADLNDLRLALGYEEWNLFGISYGTRLAQTAMRDFPEGIRSVILDSTYPIAANLATETLVNADRAFQVFFNGCAADPDCNEAHPDLEESFFNLVDELNDEPILIPVTQLFTGNTYDALVNGDSIIGLLFQSLYSSEIIPTLPGLISEVENGDYTNLSTLFSIFLTNSDFISVGMHISVQCNEEISFIDPGEQITPTLAYPELEDVFASDILIGDNSSGLCLEWGAGKADPIENESIQSNTPTLILAGEYDPITPPSWGELVAKDLSNQYFFEFPGLGHGVSVADDCPRNIALAFLDDPGTRPNESCISEMSGPVFEIPDGNEEEIVLVPFRDDLMGIEGIVPDGWEEAAPGTYARLKTALDQTVLVQQAVPGFGAEQLLGLFASQFGMEEGQESTGTYETETRAWSLYEGDIQGFPVDIAITEDEGNAYIVLLVSNANEREFLFTAVFLPALEALNLQ